MSHFGSKFSSWFTPIERGCPVNFIFARSRIIRSPSKKFHIKVSPNFYTDLKIQILSRKAKLLASELTVHDMFYFTKSKKGGVFLFSHRRVNNRAILTYHRRWETIASIHSFDHILIRPVPVRPFTVWDNFPHHNTKRPNIRRWGKLPVCDRFWCCPTYWNLTSLKQANRNPKITWSEEYLLGWALQACQCLRWNDGKLFS